MLRYQWDDFTRVEIRRYKGELYKNYGVAMYCATAAEPYDWFCVKHQFTSSLKHAKELARQQLGCKRLPRSERIKSTDLL